MTSQIVYNGTNTNTSIHILFTTNQKLYSKALHDVFLSLINQKDVFHVPNNDKCQVMINVITIMMIKDKYYLWVRGM